MKVTIEVRASEVNGQTTRVGDRATVRITNHWNLKDRVNIEIINADCSSDIITVFASDLKRAIEKAAG